MDHARSLVRQPKYQSKILEETIFTVNIYGIKTNLIINGPQVRKCVIEIITIMLLWVLENKTSMKTSDKKPIKNC